MANLCERLHRQTEDGKLDWQLAGNAFITTIVKKKIKVEYEDLIVYSGLNCILSTRSNKVQNLYQCIFRTVHKTEETLKELLKELS